METRHKLSSSQPAGPAKRLEELKTALWKWWEDCLRLKRAVYCLLELWQVRLEVVWLSKYCLIPHLFRILSSMQLFSRRKGVIPRKLLF